MDWFCFDNRWCSLRGQIVMSTETRILLVALGFQAAVIISCAKEHAPPPLPTDLKERNARLVEVEKQLENLEKAGPNQALTLLGHKDHRVRVGAANRLGELKVQSPALVENLNHDDHPNVRIAAARALGNIGNESSIRPLLTSTVDKNRKVRLWVKKAIRKFGAKAVPEIISQFSSNSPFASLKYQDEAGNWISIRDELKKILIGLGKVGLPNLRNALYNDNNWIRINAAIVIGSIGPKAKDAIIDLIEVLRRGDDNVRKFAARALGRIGDLAPDVVPALEKATRDSNKKVQAEAKRALWEIKKSVQKKRPRKTRKRRSPQPRKRPPS